MDAQDFRNAVIDATKYLAFFKKEVCTFSSPIEVEWGLKGEKRKVIPTICFMEVYEEEKYVFIFEYGRDWMIVCYEDGVNKKYFNSAEDDWDNSLDYADMFIKNGGNKYYYKLPDYDCVADINIFSLKNEPISELSEYLKQQ